MALKARIYTIKECMNCRKNKITHIKQDRNYGKWYRSMLRISDTEYVCSVCEKSTPRITDRLTDEIQIDEDNFDE